MKEVHPARQPWKMEEETNEVCEEQDKEEEPSC